MVNSTPTSLAPSTDIIGWARWDSAAVGNTGIGEPDYADMGAYEARGTVVVMVWIDESTEAYYYDEQRYITDLDNYRNVINSSGLRVKSGCLVPLPAGETTIEGVFPIDYFDSSVPDDVDPDDPLPGGISIYRFPRTNPSPTLTDFITHFNRVRDSVVPDYLCLSVDNSGSMDTDTINPYYGNPALDYPYDKFITWLDNTYGISVNNGNLIRRDAPLGNPNAFTSERWVDEMRIQVQGVIDGL